ncbi:MAG: YkgJ family cysteine cluster protein [Betaproteobacteria bacterium]|nr:YkgJ family cysteine cluster protein [Betaproteobacteria bacterium]
MTDDSRAEANRKERDAQKEAYLRRIYDRHVAQFRAAAKQDPPVVARDAHKAMDDAIARDRTKDPGSRNIRCCRGCSHCCNEAVEIWPHEAALLIRVAHENGLLPDKARLQRQSRYTVDTWRQQPQADKACAFLGGDGACTVYEFRPNACRKLLVVTDPVLCDASEHKPDSVGRWFSWEAELMESAALEVFGAALMPESLLHALTAQEAAR